MVAVLAGVLSGATGRAQQAKPQVLKPQIDSARSACRLVQAVLPIADEMEDTRAVWKVKELWLTPTGFTVSIPDGRRESLKYSDSPGVRPFGKGRSYQIDFFPARNFRFERGFVLDFHEKSAADIKLSSLVGALNYLIASARQGEGVDCKAVLDDQAQLDSFLQMTASWRALAVKPPLSEEANRQRLLAEDAMARKDSSAALDDCLAGVDIDPTWAQGWFNAALLYAEQEDYDDAVFSMKHYLILLPDAPEAPAAKEKVLLWKAKAQESAAAQPGTEAK
jgi:hypothetical protein